MLSSLFKSYPNPLLTTSPSFTISLYILIDQVRILLENGAEADFANHKGTTALMRASQEGYTTISRELILNGADVTRKNHEGMNALMLASQRGHALMVVLLVKAGAFIDEQTAQGSTALMLSCKRGNEGCVQELITLGSEIYIFDVKSRTARDNAEKKAHSRLLPLLNTSCQALKMALEVREVRNTEILNFARAHQNGRLRRQPVSHTSPHSIVCHIYTEHEYMTVF